MFWRDRWIHGVAVQDVAPAIVDLVDTRIINSRTVQQAFEADCWVSDIKTSTSFTALLQLMHLQHAITSVPRDSDRPDTFTWPCAASGTYSAKSTYNWLCQELQVCSFASAIWRSWAPLKCKIFSWLAAQYRIWTSDRRARHGLQDTVSACFTCLQEEDNVDHIFMQCVYAQETWHRCLDALQLPIQRPLATDTFLGWWMLHRQQFSKAEKRGFDTFVICTVWSLWKQRNACVFARTEQQMEAQTLVTKILDEIKDWKLALRVVGGLQRFVRE